MKSLSHFNLEHTCNNSNNNNKYGVMLSNLQDGILVISAVTWQLMPSVVSAPFISPQGKDKYYSCVNIVM